MNGVCKAAKSVAFHTLYIIRICVFRSSRHIPYPHRVCASLNSAASLLAFGSVLPLLTLTCFTHGSRARRAEPSPLISKTTSHLKPLVLHFFLLIFTYCWYRRHKSFSVDSLYASSTSHISSKSNKYISSILSPFKVAQAYSSRYLHYPDTNHASYRLQECGRSAKNHVSVHEHIIV